MQPVQQADEEDEPMQPAQSVQHEADEEDEPLQPVQ